MQKLDLLLRARSGGQFYSGLVFEDYDGLQKLLGQQLGGNEQ